MLIVNLGQLVFVVGLEKNHKIMYVTLLSLFNCIGRLLMGALSDFFFLRFKIKRLWMFAATLFLMSCAMILVSTGSEDGLFLGTVMVGTAYGAVFTCMPPLISEEFGLKHFSAITCTMHVRI